MPKKIKYLMFVKGKSCPNLPIEPSSDPYPLVLFSHGHKGINYQSFSFVVHLASHGIIVVAPSHSGNTFFNSPSDKQMAEIALRRPKELAAVLCKIKELNNDSNHCLYQKIDETSIGLAGHSFGSYTALLASGGVIDVDLATKQCLKTSTTSGYCSCIGFWSSKIITRPKDFNDIRCTLVMAPGGYSAFGKLGLAEIKIPVMIIAGLEDKIMDSDLESRQIYRGLNSTALNLEIDRAGHLSFTDLCRLPFKGIIPALRRMCNKDKFIDLDRSFEIVNSFAIAFFRKYLKNEVNMDFYLSSEHAASFPELSFERKP